MSAAGIAAGPCLRDEELPTDPHVVAHHMLAGIARPDGSEPPVLLPGNPVRIHTAPGTADTRVPWVGEDTDRILAAELDLGPAEIEQLRAEGVVA